MRNAHDWLRVTALLAGEKEQYGAILPGRKVTLILNHESKRDQFQVLEHNEHPDGTYTLEVESFGRKIDEARRRFRARRNQLASMVPNRLEMEKRR